MLKNNKPIHIISGIHVGFLSLFRLIVPNKRKMLFRLLLLFVIPLSWLQERNESTYQKIYDNNGLIKEEGWKVNEEKVGYWYFYHENGEVASQGHFLDNQKNGYWYFYSSEGQKIKEGHFEKNNAEKWWIIYDIAAPTGDGIVRKYQFRKNKKNGFCLSYRNNELFKAEKYVDNKKIGEWTDISTFKRDNPNASL